MKYLGITLLVILTLFFFSCKKKQSEQQIFEANVQACMKPLLQKSVDSLEARALCTCMLKTMLKIDSTFLQKDINTQKQLSEKPWPKVTSECDSLLKKYWPKDKD